MTRHITINGGLHADVLYATLPDGRRLTVMPSGEVTVRTGIEEYSVELPTVAEIAQRCSDAGNPYDVAGPVEITAHHRH